MIRFSRSPGAPLQPIVGAALDRLLDRAPQAEWGLAHQGAEVLLSRDRARGWLARRAGLHLVALGLPLGLPDPDALRATAGRRWLFPLLYKCDARSAQAARVRGWPVLRLGAEAMLNLAAGPSTAPPAASPAASCAAPARGRSGSRRRASFRCSRWTGSRASGPPAAEGSAASPWAGFDPGLLRRQRVLLAWSGEELVAFVSFHATPRKWALDLMRHSSGAPDGAMHRLVAEAIATARAEGAERMSLAAIPEPAVARRWLLRFGLGACWLAQFKRSFGPELHPRYAAAPSLLSLASGLASVAWAIHRPAPLPEARPQDARAWRAGRSGVASLVRWLGRPQFRFEPGAIPCDAPPAQSRPAVLPSWEAAGRPGRPDS